MDRMKRFFPFLSWLQDLSMPRLRSDFLAGVTVALVLIPQSMAYAQLAGLPSYYGLYAAFLPPMVASLFGSSRQLATGPVAVVSLMTAAALEPLATVGGAEFAQYAIFLALMVGVFQLLLGVFRLGLIVNLLSHPVVNGFTCAAALIIGTSQLSKIFGVYVEKAPHHYETVYRVVAAAVRGTDARTLGMAVLAIIVMAGLRRVNPKVPNVLVAVVLCTVVSWAIGFERKQSVPVTMIEAREVTDAVAEYNALLAEHLEASTLAASTTGTLVDLEPTEDLCLRCHTDRGGIGVLAQQSPGTALRSGASGMMHKQAGLLDRLIEVLAKQEGAARERIRGFRLTRARDSSGETHYYERDAVPAGVQPEAGSWRILVGTGALLAPDRLSAQVVLSAGGAVVGAIPSGLPGFTVPHAELSLFARLIPTAIIITILGFMEAISIAKAMAVRTRQRLDPNQELIGQGLANIVGSFGHSYACSGSFSRSAVNLRAGAVSGLSNVFASAVVVVVLLFLTPLLYYLPQAVLAAVIMMAVVGLLNVRGFVHAWKIQPFDGMTGVASFLGTLVFAPHLEWGILLGVGLSLSGYLFRTMHSPVAAMSAHPDGSLREAKRHALRQCESLALIRFDGPMNFVTASYLQSEVLEIVSSKPRLRHVLIAAHAINEVDSSGVEMLRDLIERLRSTNLDLSISGLSDGALEVFRRSHLVEILGEDHIFESQARAIAAVYPSTHAEVSEEDCPFRTLMPRTTELSLHHDGSLRDAHRHGLRLCERIAIVQFEDAINYANASFLEQSIIAMLEDRPGVRHILFAAHSIGTMDHRGANRLGELVVRLRQDEREVAFSGFKDNVLDVLHAGGIHELIGEDNIFPTQMAAIARLHGQAHEDGKEANCPFQPLLPRLTELSLHSDQTMRAAQRHHLATCRSILILRCDGLIPLVDFEHLGSLLVEDLRARTEIRSVVFDAHTLGNIHARDASDLFACLYRVRHAGYRVVIAAFPDSGPSFLLREAMKFGAEGDTIFPTIEMAVTWLYGESHPDPAEEDCPLLPVLPRVTELSLHEDGAMRDAKRRGLAICRHVAAIRFDGFHNFAHGRYIEGEVLRHLKDRPEVRSVLIVAAGMNHIDDRAARQLGHLVQQGRLLGYSFYWSGINDEVLDTLDRTGVLEIIGKESIFPVATKAIEAIHPLSHLASTETRCPLLEVVPLAPATA